MGEIVYDRAGFAARLNALMAKSGEKQAELARLLDVSKATVSGWCAGRLLPRMDRVERLAAHYGVRVGELMGGAESGAFRLSPAEALYQSLNDAGQAEFLRYGSYLVRRGEYRAPAGEHDSPVWTIKHYLTAAAAGYAAPIEGEDYELIPRPSDAPAAADFCVSITGDSMAPYIRDGELVYVQRDAPLREFDPGIFFVDGDVFCKQWCVDYTGTLHLLSANPARQDANLHLPRDSGRSVVCFGRVLLREKLPKPVYL